MPEVLNIGQFDGLVARIEPHLLPSSAAQVATDVSLDRGSLEPLKDATSDARASAIVGEDKKTVYLWRYRKWGLTCGAAGSATASAWAALADTAGFAIVIDDATLQVAPDFTGDTTMAAVATSIETALNEAVEDLGGAPGTHVVAWVADRFEFRTNGSCGLLAAHASRVDISGASWMNGASAGTGGAVVVDQELEKWLAWDGHVNVVTSQTHGDRYSRIFYAGAGLARPMMRLYDGWVEREMELRILPPATAPTHDGTPASEGEDESAPDLVRDAFDVQKVQLAIKTYGFSSATVKRFTLTFKKKGDYLIIPRQEVSMVLGPSAVSLNVQWHLYKTVPSLVVNGREYALDATAMADTYTLRQDWSNSKHGQESRVFQSDQRAYGYTNGIRGSTWYPRTYYTYKWFIEGTCKLVYANVTEEKDEEAATPTVVTYAYSYVTRYGEESAMSPASIVGSVDISTGVAVSNIADWTQTDRGILTKRLYRSAGGDFRFLADIAQGVTTYSDTKTDDELGEVPGAEFTAPLDSITGLVALANGFMAGFRGREVWFSAPWMPYAWPIGNMITVPDDIVALASQGTDCYILHKAGVMIASGSAPDVMTQAIVPISQVCVSARSVAVVGNAVMYASPDGLVLLYGADGRVLTQGHYTPEQWRALAPENMLGVSHDGAYFAFLPSKTIRFRFSEGLDAVTETTDMADAAFADPQTDLLYILPAGSGTVAVWNAGAARSMTWRSGERIYPEPLSWGAVRVVAASYPAAGAGPVTLTVYREGVAQTPVVLANSEARRLPAMRPARRWSFAVTGKATVREVCMATSMGAMP